MTYWILPGNNVVLENILKSADIFGEEKRVKRSSRERGAALVGAKTVKGPSPERASTRPAAFNAATNVANSGLAPTAISTMFFFASPWEPPIIIDILDKDLCQNALSSS
mmetsp:Transcript_11331/g.16304  ORF Transcript_11331/g.16304 Transcript_11331/m.16304 type:complete len:109 (+) Transcript_11331:478-804(+)